MISLSTVTVIIFIQFNVIVVILFIIWFLKNKKNSTKLLKSESAKIQLKKAFDELNDENVKLKQEFNEIKPSNELIEAELELTREMRDKYYKNPKTINFAHIYELRGVYLQLEQKWLNITDKDDTYWKNVYDELNELLKQNIELNKVFSMQSMASDDSEEDNTDTNSNSNSKSENDTSNNLNIDSVIDSDLKNNETDSE